MRRVREVQPLEDYILFLKFDNGKVKRFDVKPYLDTGAFKELRDIDIFNTVKISFDTISWCNDVDLCPDVLYEEGYEENGE